MLFIIKIKLSQEIFMSPEPERAWWVKGPSIKENLVGQGPCYRRKDAFTYNAKISSCQKLSSSSKYPHRILFNNFRINRTRISESRYNIRTFGRDQTCTSG